MSNITLEVLAEKIDGLTTLFNERFDVNLKDHETIAKYQKITNSRVNKLEDRCVETEKWRWKATGAFVIINMIAVPLALALIMTKI